MWKLPTYRRNKFKFKVAHILSRAYFTQTLIFYLHEKQIENLEYDKEILLTTLI